MPVTLQKRPEEIVPVEILLVEDNLGDVRLAQEAFRECSLPHHLTYVLDGAQAVDYLLQRGAFKEAKRPDLILLDLNLPRLSGHDVLEAIKFHPELDCIPTIILTTSRSPDDLSLAYRRKANAYLLKPVDLDGFFTLIGQVERFWMSVAQLPRLQAAC